MPATGAGTAGQPTALEAAVDLEHLAGDRAREVGQQEGDRVGHGLGSSTSQPSGACSPQRSASVSKPGMPRAATVSERAGGDEVDADAVGAEVAGQVAVDASSAALATPIQS